jgi:methenyltetrahydrofolate cyclohydrolase
VARRWVCCPVVSSSLWNSQAEQLLQRASSTDPTPGGGAIAAVAAAFGMSLVRMAIGVTISAGDSAAGYAAQLAGAQSRARELQAGFVEAADRDVAEFDALMAGYRMPRDTDDERERRSRAIDEATLTATRGPLGLAEASVVGIALVDEIEPSIKATIVSDAQAGRDLLRGAALAALRTADINLTALEERGHFEATGLRERRDAVLRAAISSGKHG